MAFTHPEYLVSTDWLHGHLDDPDVRILDVTGMLTSALENRAEEECYAAAHIPGSIFFDVASARGVLSNARHALPWMWPEPKQFEAAMATIGVAPETKVVLVARTPRDGVDSGTMWCTRAWWTMHHFGVDCAILRGGIEQWVAENRPLTDEPPVVPVVAPFVTSTDWTRARATKDDVLAAVDGPVCLIDALAEGSYDGTGVSYGPRAGHITGAVNVPFRSLLVAETAGFADADVIEQRLTEAELLGPAATRPVITYCGGAIAATVDAFALALFGRTDVAVYDGSLLEWSADSSLPMANPGA